MIDTGSLQQLHNTQVHHDWNVVESRHNPLTYYCEDLKRTDEASYHGAWAPTKTQIVRPHSSLLERISCLVMINELAEAEFEPIFDYADEMIEEEDVIPPPPPMLDQSTVETRWSPDSAEQQRKKLKSSASSLLLMPERLPSCSEIPLDDNDDWLTDEQSMDAPLKAPIRLKSLADLDDFDSAIEDGTIDSYF